MKYFFRYSIKCTYIQFYFSLHLCRCFNEKKKKLKINKYKLLGFRSQLIVPELLFFSLDLSLSITFSFNFRFLFKSNSIYIYI